MKMSDSTLQKVVDYLEAQPFKEVAEILGHIQQEYRADKAATAEAVELSARMKEAKDGVVVVESDAKPV